MDKPLFNADAAEEYFTCLCTYYRDTRNDILKRDNEGRHASEQVYSAEYQKFLGMELAMREVLEYFSKFDLGPTGEGFRRDRILRDAVQTWGRDAQMRMMIEEMSELTKAICKYYRVINNKTANEAFENIREEMADVQIMLDQMKIMFGNVSDHEWEKLNRLERRLQVTHERGG